MVYRIRTHEKVSGRRFHCFKKRISTFYRWLQGGLPGGSLDRGALTRASRRGGIARHGKTPGVSPRLRNTPGRSGQLRRAGNLGRHGGSLQARRDRQRSAGTVPGCRQAVWGRGRRGPHRQRPGAWTCTTARSVCARLRRGDLCMRYHGTALRITWLRLAPNVLKTSLLKLSKNHV